MVTGSNTILSSLLSATPFLIFTFGLLFYWIGAFFLLYHLLRFGVGPAPKRAAFIFLIGSFVLFLFIVIFFVQIDFGELAKELNGNKM